MEQSRPQVGVGVITLRDGKILLGERVKGHGSNTLTIPGGHVEFGETFEQTARREVYEECGLDTIKILGLVSIDNAVAYDKHYVSIGILAESLEGTPHDTSEAVNWDWYDTNHLPDTIFIPSRKVIDNWLAGIIYNGEVK